MKRKSLIITLLFVATIVVTGFVPQETNQSTLEIVSQAIQLGNSSDLAKHFNPTVELEILDDENIYSRAQAELLLKDFFTRNKPTSFKINHQGTKGNTSFAIGNYISPSGSYRVSIFMKTEKDKILIHQLRIEKSE
ncbi:MAG: DUF4783 domain-containing protein [Bacteroidetes bacterium HGW-Bacteroidetes-15]|nr:MAG: DUF4783 domain-containing protein [Bacteroidetes bacterium HGW-Bacteroidetes-15]